MKNIIKNISIIICVNFLLFVCFGCDNYERTSIVTPNITVNEHSLNMFVGEKTQLKASPTELSFVWTSEDTEVATVDSNGLVTAMGDGSTHIVASSGEKTCRVPLTSITRIPLTGFNLGTTFVALSRTGKRTLVVALEPSNANDASVPEWRSNNTDVVTVDYRGEIVAVGIGTTNVVCTINNMDRTVVVNVQ